MWSLKKLTVSDLMTFDDMEFVVQSGVVTVIYGNNKDRSTDRNKSNGSGKSALLEGFAAGITGGPLRKIKNGELVQNGKKMATIDLVMHNAQTQQEMRIERIFYPKKSAQVAISVNGEYVKELTSTNEANDYIMERLGISQEDLFNYFILSRTRYEGFLDASDTKKKEVINRFSNGYLVDSAIEELELDIKSSKEEVSRSETAYNQLYGKVEGVRESIQDALVSESSGEGSEQQVAEIQAKMEEVLCDSAESAIARDRDVSELEQAEAALDKLEDDGKMAKLKKGRATASMKAKKFHQEMQELKEDLADTRISIRELESKLANHADCPKCQHQFSLLDLTLDLDEAKEKLADLRDEEGFIIEDGKAARADYDKQKQKVSDFEDRIAELEVVRETAQNRVHKLKSSISRLDGELLRCKGRTDSLRNQLDALQTKEQRDLVTPLREKLGQLEPQLQDREDTLLDGQRRLDGLVEQKDVFRRFKTHLANKSIATIESIANDYLESIGSDIAMRIDGETELSSGKMRDKISATLYRDGEELGSFNKNSNGEKAEVNLATILTLNRMINLNAGEGKGLDMLIIDEIMDAADATGLMNMIRSMNRLGLTVLMVSHGALDANYEHTVVVEKEFGKSILK